METALFSPETHLKNLYVYPTYAVLISPPKRGAASKTDNRVKNEKNLQSNKTNGTLSPKARRRLVNAINWLLLASKKKRVFCNKSNAWTSFRISFITLTIPTTEHNLSDHYIKTKVLHAFLANCTKNYGLKNYVWKVERNKNGNLHFHLTTDLYLHHSEIRRIWNNVLSTHGIMKFYTEKMQSLSLNQYTALRLKQGTTDVKAIKKAFSSGVENGWSQPNSTDVHSVKNIRDLGAYLADYMSKKEEDKEPITGRIWGCSHSLSTTTKNETQLILSHSPHIEKDLFSKTMTIKDITVEDKITHQKRTVGTLFFYKLSDFNSIIKHGLKDIVSDVVHRIRYGNPSIEFT